MHLRGFPFTLAFQILDPLSALMDLRNCAQVLASLISYWVYVFVDVSYDEIHPALVLAQLSTFQLINHLE